MFALFCVAVKNQNGYKLTLKLKLKKKQKKIIKETLYL